ncbi:MAG: SDR family oxidoreductase [Clostridia bacterium]|nr:SDR family oxidoreductase [Clostridia bacterium]
MKRVAIVTGGTSGIGRAAVNALLDKDVTVYAFSRRPADVGRAKHMVCDVTDEAAVRSAVNAVAEAENGQIDILVNCAGFGISGAFEFTESEAAHRQMEVNVFGMNNMIRAVLPHMRARKAGRIVNIGSVAGIAPIPFQAWYAASKAAVHSLTMAVANEVKPFGITVCEIMPGDIKTGFTAARDKNNAGDDVYEGRIARSVATMEHDEQNGMDPAAVGRAIAAKALCRNPRPYVAVGIVYKALSLVAKLLPAKLVRSILYLLYAR